MGNRVDHTTLPSEDATHISASISVNLTSFVSDREDLDLPDLLIIGQEDWDEVWRRNQFLIFGLARRFPRTNFLFVELPYNLSYSLRSGEIFRRDSHQRRKLAGAIGGVRKLPDIPNVHILTSAKVLPSSFSAGERINCELQALHIKQAMSQLGMCQPLAWTQDPLAAQLISLIKPRHTIYDVTDDWTVASTFDLDYRRKVVVGDYTLTQNASLVLACSDYIYRKKSAVHKRTYLVRNGVDTQHYDSIGQGQFEVPEVLMKLPRPILGYVGTLHQERLDIPLLKHLASELRESTLLLVGPNHLSPEAETQLRCHPNIYFTGSVPYRQVPAYLELFDLCILPHVLSEFTESLDPIKAFEYLMSQRPIVSTPVAGMRELSEVVTIAQRAEFVSATRQALAQSVNYDPQPALQLARRNTWHSRVEQVLQIIRTLE